MICGVGRRRRPVEDVVGRDLHHTCTGLPGCEGHVAGANGVNRERRGFLGLGGVHRGPRRGVDNDVVPLLEHRTDRVQVTDVTVGGTDTGDLVPVPGQHVPQIGAEHAVRTGD